MFKSRNYINLSILLLLIFCVFYFNSFKIISTNIEAILPNGEKKELLKKFNEFQIGKKLFLYVDGLDINSLKKIKELEKTLIETNSLTLDTFQVNQDLQKYKTDFIFFTSKINENELNNLDIKSKLENLKQKLLNSEFLYNIDKNDPLNLFIKEETKQNFFLKNGHLAIKDKGFVSIFSINKDINSIDKYEEIYNKISNLVQNEENIFIFSSLFYFVENSQIIKSDVNKIIVLSSVLLILLYIIILRNIKLLFNSLITLGSSILIAIFILSFVFDEISIFILVFGISVSTVAIDYMFHHYVHKEYENGIKFNKDVFLGMLTTVGSFFIISFINFDLIKQLCYFTIISLLFSYLQFAFLYPIIGFKYRQIEFFTFKELSKIPNLTIIFISILLIILSMYKFNFDSNLKNLDVENKKLDDLFSFFTTNLSSNQSTAFLIKANSIDELIQNSRKIKNLVENSYAPLSNLLDEKEFLEKKNSLQKIDFSKIKSDLQNEAKDLGFKEDFFKNSYNLEQNLPNYSLQYLQNMGFEILEFQNSYISYINIPNSSIDLVKDLDFIENLSIKYMFEDNLLKIKDSLFLYGSLTILFIFGVILLTYKKNTLIYLAFILFPFACVLSISLFINFNILHIFMLFIILSISIDYGIYISSYKKDINTNKAIVYSILTTFAGFGVLIFSNINALFSIGITATIGVIAILFLLIFLKRF
ncbi:MMPL family transporter [Aliarcobacter vitoriensis]|uniref:Exporter n=1 Tax=Aliarcobacter vitoriensis TaxID=2011099 RepID=A0A366MQZ4_9BACT|nr:hypothetical protein [Aliarcobacter vitoriensis]RBQ28030.1 hypothetical protein CRU91_11460 [Aliarcobacter vitoriensis]